MAAPSLLTRANEVIKLVDFRVWHETDMPTALRDVRSQGQSGKHLLALSFSGFDR
jgi:hypothetical protein